MPTSRPKRKSRGDACLEDNGGGGGGGKDRGKEKENSAPAAKKRRAEEDRDRDMDKAGPRSMAAETNGASTANVARPKKKKKGSSVEVRDEDGFSYRVRKTRSSTAAALAAATQGQSNQNMASSSSHDVVPVVPAPPDLPRPRAKKKQPVGVTPPRKEVESKPKVPGAAERRASIGGRREEPGEAAEERRPGISAYSPPSISQVMGSHTRTRAAVGGGGRGGGGHAGSNDGTKVVLPVSDTPIIRRNQQLRQKGQGNRRSSVGMRGRRASSLMDNGVVAEPHSEVVTEEFYKHIADELLEPQRMKQLLSWCGKRALSPATSPSGGMDGNARAVARIIEEEVLKDLLSKAELSSWFNREDSQISVVARKPNPRNVDNLAKVEKCEANLRKLRKERETWVSLLRPEAHASLSISGGKPDLRLCDTSLLRPSESEFANSLGKSQDLLGSAKRLVKQQCGEIEFQVDQLIDGIHKLNQYGDVADRLGGRILEDAESTLAVREARLRQASGTEVLPIQEVLRSLSRMDR